MTRRNLLLEVLAGLVTGVVAYLDYLSFGSLLFSGPLENYLTTGVAIIVVSAMVSRVITAVASSFPVAQASPFGVSVAVTTLVVGNLSRAMSEGQLFTTTVAVMAATTALTGVLLLGLGVTRAGSLTNYVPYPVIGGYLAGVGWLLALGGGETMRSSPALWLPGWILAIALTYATRRRDHPATLPAAFLGCSLVFHLLVPREAAPSQLLGPFATGGGFSMPDWGQLARMNWTPVLDQWGSILTIVLLAAVATALTCGSLQLMTGCALDLNREMGAAGAANLVTALFGGIVCCPAPVDSVIAWNMGARTRWACLVSVGVLGVTLWGGTSLLGLVPRFVIGGFICHFGLCFLLDWVVLGWRRLTRSDYAVVVIILLVIASVGFLPGVALGLAIAVALFVHSCSRVQVVRSALDGTVCRSNVARHRRETMELRAQGRRIQVMRLQGFLFFGSAQQVLRAVDALDRQATLLLLDFAAVNGMDSSAALVFLKIRKLADARGMKLFLSDLASPAQELLQRAGVLPVAGLHPDLDRALEVCEVEILSGAEGGASGLETTLGEIVPDGQEAAFQAYLDPVELTAGGVLFHQGEKADGLYFLESGQASVMLQLPGRESRLRSFTAGTILGELGLYAREPRSATVRADVDCRLLHLSGESFERLEREEPVLAAGLHRYLVALLAERLRHRNEEVRQLQ